MDRAPASSFLGRHGARRPRREAPGGDILLVSGYRDGERGVDGAAVQREKGKGCRVEKGGDFVAGRTAPGQWAGFYRTGLLSSSALSRGGLTHLFRIQKVSGVSIYRNWKLKFQKPGPDLLAHFNEPGLKTAAAVRSDQSLNIS